MINALQVLVVPVRLSIRPLVSPSVSQFVRPVGCTLTVVCVSQWVYVDNRADAVDQLLIIELLLSWIITSRPIHSKIPYKRNPLISSTKALCVEEIQ